MKLILTSLLTYKCEKLYILYIKANKYLLKNWDKNLNEYNLAM